MWCVYNKIYAMKSLYIITQLIVGVTSPAWTVYLMWMFFTDMEAFISAAIFLVLVFVAMAFMKRAI